MATTSKRIVHSDEKRHKCHFCGAVRYENEMRKLEPHETYAVSQFGNRWKCWACRRKCWNLQDRKPKFPEA